MKCWYRNIGLRYLIRHVARSHRDPYDDDRHDLGDSAQYRLFENGSGIVEADATGKWNNRRGVPWPVSLGWNAAEQSDQFWCISPRNNPSTTSVVYL